MKPTLILDFDSTIVSVESLDLLAEISLAKHPERADRQAKIEELTKLGMEGKLDFRESLTKRIELLDANRGHIETLIKRLQKSISPSFQSHKKQIQGSADRIYVVTGGFREFVEPILEKLKIPADHLFANTFKFNTKGKIIGFDEDNPLSRAGGKVEVARQLADKKPLIVVGDGYTDYQIKEAGVADKFYCYAEIVARPAVKAKANRVVYGIDQVLAESDLPTRYSFPRSKIKVLLLDNIDSDAADKLAAEGYRVEQVGAKLSEDDLVKAIKNVSIIGVRTRTKLTPRVLAAAEKLMAIGVFSVGTDHVDVRGAAEKGIAVFNAPFSNTRSVVELALGEAMVLMRRVVEHSTALHQGKWTKTADRSFEIRGKKLGIIGYGNIGSQLSVLAESVGIEVLYYDIAEKLSHGNAKRALSLQDLLKQSDIISVHFDGRASNKNLIGEKEFDMMKPGVIFLNLSRGTVVNYEALAEAVRSGKVGGAGIDVFPNEPKSNAEPFESVLQGLPNVILTPHIAGSTIEAQRNIANYVSERLLKYLAHGETLGSVSLPDVYLPPLQKGMRILHIHSNVPGIVANVSSIFAKHGVNIVGQSLKTRDSVGYLVTEIADKVPDDMLMEIREVSETIKLRVVYP
ncbi:MAG: phosphoglycerate dehydrogenase [Armatimonadetes bacterium]|nr:phosphoglycerate dehydrogenase [Armatimonadota bacterium]